MIGITLTSFCNDDELRLTNEIRQEFPPNITFAGNHDSVEEQERGVNKT